jgi:hypothetical protein
MLSGVSVQIKILSEKIAIKASRGSKMASSLADFS